MANSALDDRSDSSVMLELFETFERLLETVETELDDDCREGAALDGEAWADARERILARVRASKRLMDRDDVLAVIGH